MQVMHPEPEDLPKEVIIKKAEGGFIINKIGGFIINKIGGGSSFNDKPIVTTEDGFDDALAKCKKWLLK